MLCIKRREQKGENDECERKIQIGMKNQKI